MAIDVYERITARVLEQLERGTVPWHKPWRGGEAGCPRNLISRRPYRGINVFLLSACTPFESPFWLTFRQANELGGHVRKGAKSTPIVFWKWLRRENAETGETEQFPLLRYYNVFNVAQCELPTEKVPALPSVPTTEFEPIGACEQILEGMPERPAIYYEGAAAYYRPLTDSVHLPKPEHFDSPEHFYGTVFHELIHATGHESRLNRHGITETPRFGTQTYSKEELVAEMGAAFLCGHAGIENNVIDNSASYVAEWLKRLRDDKRLVVHAAAAAQKAADFILGREFEGDADQDSARTPASDLAPTMKGSA